MCKEIDDPKKGNNTWEKLYGAANIYYNYTGNLNCFDLSDHPDPHGLSEWSWQVPLFLLLLNILLVSPPFYLLFPHLIP